MEGTIDTCERCGYAVDPAEGNLERNNRGQMVHSVARCFEKVNQALNDLGWPKERRAERNIGGEPRAGQTRERDPTQTEKGTS